MAYTVIDVKRDVTGYHRVIATIDITSLANAGNEPISADDFGMSRIYGASLVGHELADYVVEYDHVNDQLDVVDFTGANVTAATDVGEVRLEIVGV